MKTIPLLLVGLYCLALALESPAAENPPKGLAASDWSSIRAAYEAGRHAVHRQENGTLTARNPGQQWRTEFDGKGFTVTPDHGQWTWGLELIGYGERTLLSAPSFITHDGGKISCQRDENLTEWFINDTRGLEQGWTIHSRSVGSLPAIAESDGRVSPTSPNLTLTLRGDLQAQVSLDASSVAFQTSSGGTALTYGGLKAWDADGTNLTVRFEPVGENAIRIAVEEQNARYPITIDPVAQQAFLKASNTGASDSFGFSVAVSGDTVVVGAPYEDSSTRQVNSAPNESALDSGAAYVFTRSGTTWSQQAYLKAYNTGFLDYFGYSVAVSGDMVVVGAPGEDSTPLGVNSTDNNNYTNSGAAYVFSRNGTTWSQQVYPYLKASNTGGQQPSFGVSVAVFGNTVVVGASGDDTSATGVNNTPNGLATDSGAAYVFIPSGTTWSQQAYLKASNTGQYDEFGISVAVSGDTVVVGALGEASSTTGVNSTPNESAPYSGAAYVFTRSGTTWSQQAYLKASNTGSSDEFGLSVAVSGDTVVVGASGEDSSTTGVNSLPNDSASNSGAAYVFTRIGTTWSQQAYLKASNTPSGPGLNDNFGYSVALSGDTVVVGAPFEDSSTTGVNSTPNDSTSDAGAAYVFVRSGGIWSQQAYLKASNTRFGYEFGSSVAVSGNMIVVGSPGEQSYTTGVNSTPDQGATNSGAAYVFVRSGSTWTQQAYLKASNSGPGVKFGSSVAVGGETVVVGAPLENSSTSGVNSTPNFGAAGSGAAYVFVRSSGNWSQQAYLKASNTGAGDQFGFSVAVSGDTALVGAYFEDSSTSGVNSTPNESAADSGAAYVFVRSGSTWSQQAYIKASNTGADDFFGNSVAVSGDTVVVGARSEDSNTTGVNSTPNESETNSGAAYVFTRSGSTWSQQAYLKASNTGAFDIFGWSVALDGDTVVIGARGEDSSSFGVNGTSNNSRIDSGAAYVFVRSGGGWSQQAFLKASNTGASDFFGSSVAVSGDTVVVGAYQEDSSTTGVNSLPDEAAFNSGAAYIFSGLGPPPTVAITAVSPDPRTAPVTTMTITFSAPVQNFDLSDLTLTRNNGSNLINGSFSLATANNTLFTLTIPATTTTPGGSYRLAVLVSNIVDLGGIPLGFGGEEQWLTLPTDQDTDGDGMNDASEFNMAALGFDWQVSQPALVNTYYDNANGVGYYSLSQVQALNTGTPLITRNPTTGKFKLTMDWKKSTNLTNFTDFPAPVGSSVSITPQGDVEFEFSSTDNAVFYRIEVD